MQRVYYESRWICTREDAEVMQDVGILWRMMMRREGGKGKSER